MLGFIKRNIEYFIVIVLTIFFFGLLIYLTDFVNLYEFFDINTKILSFIGSLFGLLLAAYAIFFGLVPSIEKGVLETSAFEKTNKLFLLSIVLSIVIIIKSVFIYFTKNVFLIYFQVFLLFFVIFMSFILVICLYYLFKITRSNLLKTN